MPEARVVENRVVDNRARGAARQRWCRAAKGGGAPLLWGATALGSVWC